MAATARNAGGKSAACRGPPPLRWTVNSTAMAPIATPDDIASAVTFLASPQAAYITGATLHVNGGMYMA